MKNIKKIDFILIVLDIVLAIIVAGMLAFYLSNKADYETKLNSHEKPLGSSNTPMDDELSYLTPFEELTKEQALTFLQEQTNSTGTLPENYVGEEIPNAIIIRDNTYISGLRWIYSYDTTEDLKESVREIYGRINGDKYNEDNYEFKEYAYYTIVTPKRIKEVTSCDHGYNSDCDSLLSFKRSYLDYHMEEVASGVHNDAYYLNTKDSKVANYILRVCSFFSGFGLNYGDHGNIYSYEFGEQDDKYVLTVNNVGAGFNMDLYNRYQSGEQISDDESQIAINLYKRRFYANKTDGRIGMIPTETGVAEYIRSFPITEDEFSSLPGYGE